jgi:hypothetical protein
VVGAAMRPIHPRFSTAPSISSVFPSIVPTTSTPNRSSASPRLQISASSSPACAPAAPHLTAPLRRSTRISTFASFPHLHSFRVFLTTPKKRPPEIPGAFRAFGFRRGLLARQNFLRESNRIHRLQLRRFRRQVRRTQREIQIEVVIARVRWSIYAATLVGSHRLPVVIKANQ